jgi:Acyl-CoA reductase (LuxC)
MGEVKTFAVPFVVRGRIYDEATIEHDGPGFQFFTPDPLKILSDLPLCSNTGMADLHELRLTDIVEFLAELGKRLSLDKNPHMRKAFELSVFTSNLPEQVLRTIYAEHLDFFFRPDILADAVERRIGAAFLEGWVDEEGPDGRSVRIRAYGARTAHVIAGNTPGVAAITVARNALTRGDAIIKTPRNDPMTAAAIAVTMVEFAPDHPLTRHVSVLYWHGGDESIEPRVFSSTTIDKIVAWGGSEAIRNAGKYVGPGVELIALDPKRSISLIGPDALDGGPGQAEAAERLARDVGFFNQEGCVSPRVAYVCTEGVEDARARVRAFASDVYSAIGHLPAAYSAPVERLAAALAEELKVAALMGDPWVVGGSTAGGVVVSSKGEAVEFAEQMACRYVNVVPVEDFDVVIGSITSTVQTVGVWPEPLRTHLRHRLSLAGAQRIVNLGGATNSFGNQSIPQDGIEVLRRMCRWIVDEGDPAIK